VRLYVGRQLELSTESIAMPLRMIEIYTDLATYETNNTFTDPAACVTSSTPVDPPMCANSSMSSDAATYSASDVVFSVVQHLISNGLSLSALSVHLFVCMSICRVMIVTQSAVSSLSSAHTVTLVPVLVSRSRSSQQLQRSILTPAVFYKPVVNSFFYANIAKSTP